MYSAVEYIPLQVTLPTLSLSSYIYKAQDQFCLIFNFAQLFESVTIYWNLSTYSRIQIVRALKPQWAKWSNVLFTTWTKWTRAQVELDTSWTWHKFLKRGARNRQDAMDKDACLINLSSNLFSFLFIITMLYCEQSTTIYIKIYYLIFITWVINLQKDQGSCLPIADFKRTVTLYNNSRDESLVKH